MPVTHSFVSQKDDADDNSLVRPSNWNAEHIIDVDLATEVSGILPLEHLSGLTTSQFASTNVSQWTNDAGYLTANQSITISGDASGTGTTSIPLTLATVNSNVGTFGSATQVAQVTVNGKGLVTGVSNVTISGVAPGGAAGGDLSGTYPNPTVSKINGVALGDTTATAGNILIGSGSDWVTRAMSGDITITSTGVTAIGALKVTNAMIANSTIDLTAKVTGILPGANGGTGNGFFAVSGPATSLKTFTFPNASATVLTTNAVVTAAQGGTGQDSSAWAQGDLVYISATGTWNHLAKDTNATRYLSNTGTSNNPAWAQINLANGVTGILPNANTTAASANTASAIVARDSNGDFFARNITLTGDLNSWSANQVNFYTDTGTTLKGYVGCGRNNDLTLKSSTSGNWLRLGVNSANIAFWMNGNVDANESPQITFDSAGKISAASMNLSGLTASRAVVTNGSKDFVSLEYTSSNTVSTLVQRDGSGNFSAGTITATLTGTATTANNVATADEASDTTCFIGFVTASGTQSSIPIKTNTGLTYNSSTNNVGATTFTGALSGNATTATTATNSNNAAISNDTTTNATFYPTFVSASSGNRAITVDDAKLFYNPASGKLSATSFGGDLTGNAATATDATNTDNIGITDDTTTNATMYPVWVTASSGDLPAKVSSSKLSFNPSTGTLTATTFSGAFSGTVTNAINIGTANEASDTTCFPVFVTASGTQTLPAKTNTNLRYDSSAGAFGVGNANPSYAFHAQGEDAGAIIAAESLSGATNTSAYFYGLAAGTIKSIFGYRGLTGYTSIYHDGTWVQEFTGTQVLFADALKTTDSTASSSTSTGSGIFAGGVGVAGNAYIGGNINNAALTASQAVVTDGSKNLTSVAYTENNTPSTIVKRDSNGSFLAEVVTAASAFLVKNGSVTVSDFLRLGDDSQSSGNKYWGQGPNGTTLFFYTINDAFSSSVNWLEVVRSGTSISSVTFPAGSIKVGSATLAPSGSAGLYPARALVNFDGTTAANVSGTYSRTGTTVTCTVTNHGLLVGHLVYLDITSGTATDGLFPVATVADANTFTITHGTSGSTSGNVTLTRRLIRYSLNVSCVTFVASGTGDCVVNYASAMPTSSPVVIVTGQESQPVSIAANGTAYAGIARVTNAYTDMYVRVASGNSGGGVNFSTVNVTVTC